MVAIILVFVSRGTMCRCNRALQLRGGGGGDGGGGGGSSGGGLGPHSVPAYSIPTVDTSEWGPALWNALHIAAAITQDVPFWQSVLAALRDDIPCPDCRSHFSGWLSAHPFRVKGILPIRRMFGGGRRSPPPQIIPWLLDLHNDVNARTGKPGWNEQQLLSTYTADKKADGKASLESIQGLIGGGVYELLMRVLG